MKQNIIIVLGFVFIVSGVWYMVSHRENTSRITADVVKEQSVKEFFFKVVEGKLILGPELMTVNKGSIVSIKILSDEAEELHVHGYDKSLEFEPNAEAELRFTADVAGRFPVELENSKTDITTLEVLP